MNKAETKLKIESGAGKIVKLSQILGQKTAIQQIRNALHAKVIPSAWIFHGPPHVGKRSTAIALATTLNCESLKLSQNNRNTDGCTNHEIEACGLCTSCRLAAVGNNLHITQLLPEGISIKIDQLRKATENIALSTSAWGRRVLILARAETMRIETTNALLKTLEEPPGNGILILTTSRMQTLPETVISRCVKLPFQALSSESLSVLLESANLPVESLQFAIRFSQGSFLPSLVKNAEEWSKLEQVLLGLVSQQHRSFAKISAYCAKWATGDDWQFVLNWLENWWRDIAVLKANKMPSDKLKTSETQPNNDYKAIANQVAKQFSLDTACQAYQDTVEAQQKIAIWHTNKQLALEQLWLSWPNYCVL